MIVLGLEASCDETAAAIIDTQRPPSARILSSVIHSQLDEHRPYGGVVPEIAARAHLEKMDEVIATALDQANCKAEQIELVTATAGPGLIGGVLVSACAGRGFALALGRPYQDTNHLAGHALTARLTDQIAFPYLLLLVSGGHCQLVLVEGPRRFETLGSTIDDAVGEAFDKVAKLLDLGFPGGPALEACAKAGNAARFDLPIPLQRQPNFNFSFSGLKTAVRRALELLPQPPSMQDKADLAASFQRAAALSLTKKTERALAHVKERFGRALPLAVAGGVAANGLIRSQLESACAAAGSNLYAAPLSLCGDNAAMIAWAGFEAWQSGDRVQEWGMAPRPRWPLMDLNAPKA